MDRTEAEIEAERAKAQQYFYEQFGLDDGTQLSNIRNVLTFPGIGFEGEALLQQ